MRKRPQHRDVHGSHIQTAAAAAAAAATSHFSFHDQEKMSKSDPNSAIFMEDMAQRTAAAPDAPALSFLHDSWRYLAFTLCCGCLLSRQKANV
jgi:L-alanine-DL-glutamate epimerase-like enolase superfamily enzyme